LFAGRRAAEEKMEASQVRFVADTSEQSFK
jgi:hypothetical protein